MKGGWFRKSLGKKDLVVVELVQLEKWENKERRKNWERYTLFV